MSNTMPPLRTQVPAPRTALKVCGSQASMSVTVLSPRPPAAVAVIGGDAESAVCALPELAATADGLAGELESLHPTMIAAAKTAAKMVNGTRVNIAEFLRHGVSKRDAGNVLRMHETCVRSCRRMRHRIRTKE